jgi:hypothetical protein
VEAGGAYGGKNPDGVGELSRVDVGFEEEGEVVFLGCDADRGEGLECAEGQGRVGPTCGDGENGEDETFVRCERFMGHNAGPRDANAFELA